MNKGKIKIIGFAILAFLLSYVNAKCAVVSYGRAVDYLVVNQG